MQDDGVTSDNDVFNAMGMEGGQKVFVALVHRPFSISGKRRCSELGSRLFWPGIIHIWRKWTGSTREALNSLCEMPVPALMRCASPGRISEPIPRLSLCSS